MKKLFLTLAALFIMSFVLQAQDKSKTNDNTTVNIGGNVGTGTKEEQKTSYGGDIEADIPVATDLKVTGSAGYQHVRLGISTYVFDYNYVVLMAGLKYFLLAKLYGHAQLGYALYAGKGGGGDFSYAPSLGYLLSRKLDIAVKYLSISSLNFILFRLALTLGK